MPSEVFQIPVNRIHLYEANPRHGEITDPEEIIEYLLEDEQVYELAKKYSSAQNEPSRIARRGGNYRRGQFGAGL